MATLQGSQRSLHSSSERILKNVHDLVPVKYEYIILRERIQQVTMGPLANKQKTQPIVTT